MRHATLLLSSLMALASSAQDYLANEPVWRQHSICATPGICLATRTYNYFTAGDSIIDNVEWTKVLEMGTCTLSWQGPGPFDPGCQGDYAYTAAMVWLIRQEGRQLRIWDSGMDTLLYDFDLEVGDTLPLTWNNWNTDITVLAVDSILIGTEMRARYQLGNSWAQYLIEGVGSTNGLFEPLSNFLECGFNLECFGLGSDAYYPSVAIDGSCWMPLALSEAKTTGELTIAPNPADDLVRITSAANGPCSLVVRDMQGSIVLQARLASALTTSLDVSGMPNGCYAVSVNDAPPKRLVVAH